MPSQYRTPEMPADKPIAATAETPALVLDTNVLLDWLVFEDPSAAALDRAIRAGAWQWHATKAMRDEMEQVLTREHILSRLTDPATARRAWQRWARLVNPGTAITPIALRCTDADDQKFIDLALQLGATLLSRDRAVLRLARAGRGFGVNILSPLEWAAIHAADPPLSG